MILRNIDLPPPRTYMVIENKREYWQSWHISSISSVQTKQNRN